MELFKRNIIHDELQDGLNIVKKFIVDKSLILTGGMTIDLSLKMKNLDGIYDNNTVPDYDCISPNHYQDACELALILCEFFKDNGSVDIGVIPALHVQSIRVRLNFEPIADITYVPKNIYDKIPFLVVPNNYDESGMRITHPLYQMCDQHRSFIYPFENFPREVVFNRLRKDIIRFDLLFNAFLKERLSIDKSNSENSNSQVSKLEKSNFKKSSSEKSDFSSFELVDNQQVDEIDVIDFIKKIIEKDFVYYGITAYNVFIHKKIFNSINRINRINSNVIEILSDRIEDVENYLNSNKIKYEKYNKTIDIISSYILFINNGITYKIYNNYNSKICISHEMLYDINIVHIQGILMYLLFNHCLNTTNIDDESIFIKFYNVVYNTISSNENDNRDYSYITKENEHDYRLPIIVNENILTYGKYNRTDNYIIQHYELCKKLNLDLELDVSNKHLVNYEHLRIKPYFTNKSNTCKTTYENSEMDPKDLSKMLSMHEYNRTGEKIE